MKNFFKKHSKKIKTFVLIILILLIFHTVRNCIIYLSIFDKHEQTVLTKTNYHCEIYHYSLNNVLKEDWYIKDNKYLVKFDSYDIDNYKIHSGSLDYCDGNKVYSYVNDLDNNVKYYHVYDISSNSWTRPYVMDSYNKPSFVNVILSSLLNRFKSTVCNGKDCYTNYSESFFIDKNTGIAVSSSHSSEDNSGREYTNYMNCYIDFDVVTDENLQVPNVEEYKYYEDIKDDLIKSNLSRAIKSDDKDLIQSFLVALIKNTENFEYAYSVLYDYFDKTVSSDDKEDIKNRAKVLVEEQNNFSDAFYVLYDYLFLGII